MNKNETDKFWQGWVDALEALETRIEFYQKEITSRSSPWDVILDIHSEITDLLDLTNMKR